MVEVEEKGKTPKSIRHWTPLRSPKRRLSSTFVGGGEEDDDEDSGDVGSIAGGMIMIFFKKPKS